VLCSAELWKEGVWCSAGACMVLYDSYKQTSSEIIVHYWLWPLPADQSIEKRLVFLEGSALYTVFRDAQCSQMPFEERTVFVRVFVESLFPPFLLYNNRPCG